MGQLIHINRIFKAEEEKRGFKVRDIRDCSEPDGMNAATSGFQAFAMTPVERRMMMEFTSIPAKVVGSLENVEKRLGQRFDTLESRICGWLRPHNVPSVVVN